MTSVQNLPDIEAGATDLSSKELAALPRRRRVDYLQILAGVVLLAILIWIVMRFAQGQIRWDRAGDFIFNNDILLGLSRTLQVTALSGAIAIVVGILCATMRLSSNRVASGIAWLYVWIFRGTPELLQLIIWFNIALVFPVITVPFVGSTNTINIVTPFIAAVLGLSLNSGAYISENVRGSILAVNAGQTEASMALGLSRATMLRRVILPQAMPSIVPAIGNQIISLLKASSLAAAISYTELLGEAQSIYYVNGLTMEILFVVALWYLIATSIAGIIQYYIERHYGRSERHQNLNMIDVLARRLVRSIRSGRKQHA